MPETKKPLFLWLAAGGLGALLLAGFVFYPRLQAQWSAPLGPGLELPTLTYTPLPAPAEATAALRTPSSIADADPAAQASATPALADTPTPTPQPLCGGPAVMTVLGIGADSGLDYNYGLADVIRIARVDFTIPKVTMLSIPRDLWVEIPDLENAYNIDHGKLNQAYFYGGQGMGYYQGPGGGPGLLARTLDLNFGLRVEHYGAVNMQTFVKIVDAVGGLDIYLPTDVDGRPIDERTEDMGYFYAGQNHFTGEEALRFSRIRKKYNDFTRADHQNMVLCALKEKVTSPVVLPKIPQIIAAFQDAVLTDLSLEQLSQLACLAPYLKRENLIFTGLPAELFTPGRVYSPQQKAETFVMEADFEVIRDYVQRFVAGEWPSQPDEPTCP
ncbi:MAG: LCP family protein [Chloroflexi bacterium]|nr:LCP family protein [Chloroflexota bacterium]